MEEQNQLTTEEKRKNKIAQLKARLQKEEALLNQNFRKVRNGQLIAFGVLVEEAYKNADDASRKKWQDMAKKQLKDRNLDRAVAGFERLELANKPRNHTPEIGSE